MAAGFGASLTAAVVLGYLGWRGSGPVRRLLDLLNPTDEGLEVRGELLLEVPLEELDEAVKSVRRLAMIQGIDPDEAVQQIFRRTGPA